jgi:MtrB/PioB family decaheme-associated outer membrane protein
MKSMRSLKAIALAGTCLLPLAAMAEDNFDLGTNAATPVVTTPVTGNHYTILPIPPLEALPYNQALPYNNEVIVGLGWQSGVGIKFGRYTGLTDRGAFALGGFTLRGGDAWDSGGTSYYRAQGTDLGLDSRSLNLSFGQQGTWGVNLSYDGIPYFQSNTFHSLWGKSNGLLAPGILPGRINNLTRQAPPLAILDVQTQRDIFRGSGSYQYGDWTITSSLRHEHKEGTKENSLTILGVPSPIAGNGNITTSALGYFAEPIDYDTDRFDIAAQYAEPRLQVQVGYTYSSFQDNATSWNGINPFLFTGTGVTGAAGTATAGSALISSRYALPPSNSAHQVHLQVGYNLTPTTRVNANFQYGLMLQNAGFADATGNANLAPIAPPRSNFDGAMQTVHGNVALTASPIPKSDFRVSYTIDDRSNLSPRNLYREYLQDAFSANPTRAFNLPMGYDHQVFDVTGGYRILPQTKVTLGYAYDWTRRSDGNTPLVAENSFIGKVRSNLFDDTYGSVSLLHQDRHAQAYDRNAVWKNLGQNESEFFGFVNYYEASRQRDEGKLTFDFSPTPNLSATVMGKADYDYYPRSPLGLKSNNNFSIGPDISYRFSPALTAHAYYTYQLIYFNQNNAVTNAACNGNGATLTTGPAPCLNNGVWNGRNTDDTHTAGVSLDWQVLPETLKVGADYTISYGRNSYSIMDGGVFSFTPAGTAALQLAPLPDVTSLLNSVTLRAEYKLMENASLWLGYTFESLNYKDYATQVGPTQFSNAAFSGDGNQNYSVHLIMAALRYRF